MWLVGQASFENFQVSPPFFSVQLDCFIIIQYQYHSDCKYCLLRAKLCFFGCLFETRSCHIDLAGFQLGMFLLIRLLPPQCWDFRCVLPCLAADASSDYVLKALVWSPLDGRGFVLQPEGQGWCLSISGGPHCAGATVAGKAG